MTGRMRIIRCPACEHEGAIPRHVPMTSKLRCRVCGECWLVREATGPRPCVRKQKSPAAEFKAKAAREVLQRYDGEFLDDDLHDLWPTGGGAPRNV